MNGRLTPANDISKPHPGGADWWSRKNVIDPGNEGDVTMRTILLASLVAAGIGLAGTSGASALPANGAAIGDAATTANHVTPVQWGWGHWRWGSRGGHWRWGSRW